MINSVILCNGVFLPYQVIFYIRELASWAIIWRNLRGKK